jgi:hypothetical protein
LIFFIDGVVVVSLNKRVVERVERETHVNVENGYTRA